MNLNFLIFIQMLDENHLSRYQDHSPTSLKIEGKEDRNRKRESQKVLKQSI